MRRLDSDLETLKVASGKQLFLQKHGAKIGKQRVKKYKIVTKSPETFVSQRLLSQIKDKEEEFFNHPLVVTTLAGTTPVQ